MAITFHPRKGQILMCDFSIGFKEPEMVKKRPVIVISPPMEGRSNIVTVAAMSTAVPKKIMPYHYQVPKASMPQLGTFQEKNTWLKGDMIYAVGFHRLELIRLNKKDPNTGKRVYFDRRLGKEQMNKIYTCVLHGLSLGAVSEFL